MNCEIETLEVKPNDIIVIKYNIGETPVDELNEFFLSISKCFPNNKGVMLPNNMSIAAEDAKNIIKYLQEVAE